MTVPPLLSEKDLNKVEAKSNPRRIYLLYEGANTEVALVNPLCSNSAFFRSSRVQFTTLRKTKNTKGVTNPKGLIKEARKWINGNEDFASGRDKVMIFFDLDVLGNDQAKMNELLKMKTNDLVLCFTNPAIELFILLSKPQSYEAIIEPQKKDIIGNEFIQSPDGSKERYIYNLVKNEMGLDTKDSSIDFRPILENIEIAFKQENMFLNHLLTKAANTLTSNIAYVLTKISKGRIDDIRYE